MIWAWVANDGKSGRTATKREARASLQAHGGGICAKRAVILASALTGSKVLWLEVRR